MPESITVLAGAPDDAPWASRPWRSGTVDFGSIGRPGPRGLNEDALLVEALGPNRMLLAVADGCGGMPAGGRAAMVGLDALREHARSSADASAAELLLGGFDAANHAVLDLRIGCACTLAAVVVDGGTARAAHVGDADILVVGQRGCVRHRTVAHAPTGYGVAAGLMSDAVAMDHDERATVLNVVGDPAMRIEIGPPVRLRALDTVLLASDGLGDNLLPDEIAALARRGSGTRALSALVELASDRMERGGETVAGKPDDLTVILLRPSGVTDRSDRSPR